MTLTDAVASTALAVLSGVVGLAVGSFLNVVVWRVPRGQSVVRPASACPGCSTPLVARDNIPLVSWILLRGRCRTCACPISVRYPVVEVTTAALFTAAAAWAARQHQIALLPALLYLVAIGVALALIDLDVRRLPDVIVLPAYPVTAVLLGVAALLQQDAGAAARAAAGGVVLWLLYFGLCVARPGGMGFGDVKLAGVLGAYLGYAGWSALVVGGFAAFVLGGAVGVALVVTRRAGRRSSVPFGPFMLAGTALGIVVGAPVTHWYLQTSGLLPS